MVTVNEIPIEYREGMTVQELVDYLRDQDAFKQFFLYDTHAVIIENTFINREHYETTPIADGAQIILRAMPRGG